MPAEAVPATTERIEGPTPAGGAYAIAYFYDAARNGVPKASATGMEIVEFDARGEAIHRTYLDRVPKAGGAP